MNQIISTLILLGLAWVLKQFHWLEGVGAPLIPSTMTVGFMILLSHAAGKGVAKFKLPKITGYMILGIIIGPYFLNIVSHNMTHQLQLINGLALSLIAITAGGELKLSSLKSLWKSLIGITILQVIFLFVLFVGFVFIAHPWFPFLKDASLTQILVVGSILGAIAGASSPAVAMAIINECESEGSMTDSVLGVTVFKDIVVIIFFTAVLTIGKGVLNPDVSFDLHFLLEVVMDVGLSIVVGVGLGILILVYLRFINSENTLFLIFVCFLSAEIGVVFHLEPAIIALSAGFFMENLAPEKGDRLVHALERGSLPVYTLFFCLAGCILNMDALTQMWGLALVLVIIRLGGLFGATYLGSQLGGGSDHLSKLGWMGFIAQAGVSLGLAAMLVDDFPSWGTSLQTLIIAVIAINQLVGPIACRFALIHSGEAKIN